MRFIFYYILLRWFFRICLCAQQDPIETLTVAIEGDFSGLLDDVDKGVEKTKDKLGDLGNTGEKAGLSLTGMGGKAGMAFGAAAAGAGILLNAVVALGQAAVQMFANLASGAIQANAQFETFATQFETLLGSSQAAQDRLEELARFGVETPFELPEVVEASRTLQVFGGTALATGDNLRMIGDIAAGVNQPFQDVAFWVGRMYDSLKNGQPFGEASARLQEMGALSGDTRRKLEQMQKTGEDGQKIFAVFSEEVGGRFAGNMERLSKTFQGVTSNLADFQGNLLRVGGQPFFEEIRESAIQLLAILDANAPALEAIAEGMGRIAGTIVGFARENILEAFDFSKPIESVKSFIEWLERVTRGLLATGEQVWNFIKAFDFIGKLIVDILQVAFGPLIRDVQFAGSLFARLDEALLTAAKGLAIITATIEGLKVAAAGAWDTVKSLGMAVVGLATGNIDLLKESLIKANDGIAKVQGSANTFNDSILESAKSIDAMINPVKEATEEVKALGQAQVDAAQAIEDKPLIDPSKLESFSNQLIDATEGRQKKQEELEENHAEKIASIINDGNQKAIGIEEKYNNDMAKLSDESAKKRLDVIEKTRDQLNDLQKDTDNDLRDRRKEFNQSERRETENHLRDMRRLQEDHLSNLEDAVRDRDAGAIVDLQRQFQKERGRREEDFQVNRSRQSEDFDGELDAIRQNEAERREELLTAQAQALADIQQHEDEKRIELEDRRREENEKLQQNLQDRLQRENQSFTERQAALDEALQKQLESIAKNLADEKEVTEEGAREILETFDEYFGIGGNIDELMADFSRRRKIRADITVAFSGDTEPPPDKKGSQGDDLGNLLGGGRLGGVQEFAQGGVLVASKPTLALFGEGGPEVAQFTPMSELTGGGASEPGRMVVEFTGSAPPGIGGGERDQIAAVLLTALRDSGVLG